MLGLEYLVKKNKTSYTNLSKEIGVTPQTVQKWTKGKPIPKHHLKTLSSIFEVEEDYIKEELSPTVIAGVENQELKNTLDQSFLTFESPNQVVNIAFQPTGDKVAKHNFIRTIKQPVPSSIIHQHLQQNEVNDLQQMYGENPIEVWGVKEGQNGVTKKQYDKLSVGDIVLFYQDWFLYCKAVVTYKVHSPQLANAIWDDPHFEHIYFLTDVESNMIPIEFVNKTIYGKNQKFPVMGFKVLSSEQSELLFNTLEMKAEPLLKDITEEDYLKAIKLDIDKPLDTIANRVSRVEQGYLRKLLFGKKLYAKCSCCKNTFAVSQLYAAHIKKRSHCDVEEKLDSQIVMPMCKFGCDTLYEDGYLSVNSYGNFVRLDNISKKKVTPRVDAILSELDGQNCSYWNNNTSKYFEWHNNFHSKM